MPTIVDIYEFVTALLGSVFCSWLIHQMIFADTTPTTEELAMMARRRASYGMKSRTQASKPDSRVHYAGRKVTTKRVITTLGPTDDMLAMSRNLSSNPAPKTSLNTVKTSSNMMMRKASSGWRVEKIDLRDNTSVVSRIRLSKLVVYIGRNAALRSGDSKSSLKTVKRFLTR